MRFKACKKCGMIVPAHVKSCPNCKSTEFGLFEGALFVLEPEKSFLAKTLNVDKKGIFAQKVYRVFPSLI